MATVRLKRVARARGLAHLWGLNFCIGWPERARGLHYWLGFESLLVLQRLRLPPGAHLLDIGSGAYSTFPYLAAHLYNLHVTALDLSDQFDRQRGVKARATRTGLCRPEHLDLVQADARALPFAADTFDAFSAISSLEHVDEPARVLRPGGRGLVTLPFRGAGSVLELTTDLDLFQRHYSLQTRQRSLIAPSGLREVGRLYYGERLPFYALTRRLPSPLDWLRRPWDTLLTRLLLREVSDPTRADAVLVELEKPSPTDAPGIPRREGQEAHRAAEEEVTDETQHDRVGQDGWEHDHAAFAERAYGGRV